MSEKANTDKKSETRKVVVTKAEEYLYNNEKSSYGKQIGEITQFISKLYDI